MQIITVSIALFFALCFTVQIVGAQSAPGKFTGSLDGTGKLTGMKISFEPLKVDLAAPKLPSAICKELSAYVDLVKKHGVTSPNQDKYEKETMAHRKRLEKTIEDIQDENVRKQAVETLKHIDKQIFSFIGVVSMMGGIDSSGKTRWVSMDGTSKKNLTDSLTTLKDSITAACQ